MRWTDGTHRPRRMTVEEFREWKRAQPGFPVRGISGCFVLKPKLTWWDRWLDRRWERKHGRDDG